MVPEAIRHESILAIGYFVMGNKDNQLWVHQGEQPTILNQLCMLPFHYFSEPELKGILFPTLVSSLFLCDEAKEIVRNEVSLIHMASYLTGSFFRLTIATTYNLRFYRASNVRIGDSQFWKRKVASQKCRQMASIPSIPRNRVINFCALTYLFLENFFKWCDRRLPVLYCHLISSYSIYTSV